VIEGRPSKKPGIEGIGKNEGSKGPGRRLKGKAS
jgi:hypothetical protein